jgi:pyroglutamyl-peptidase
MIWMKSVKLPVLIAICVFLFFGAGCAAPEPKIILLAGFEPYGGYDFNTSFEAIKTFDGKKFGGYEVRIAELPVSWGKSAEKLFLEIEKNKPSIVICSGMGTPKIRVETIARNRTEQQPDNEKKLPPAGGRVVADGPFTYNTGLPVLSIIDKIRSAGIPVALGDDAGGYLCGWTFYQLMHRVHGTKVLGGFVHVPVARKGSEAEREIIRAWEILLNEIIISKSNP